MILEKESEIKILRNFYENPFEYFSIAEISEKTDISRNWTYKVMGKLVNSGILSESGKKYKLDFSNIFCKRLKLLFDADFLESQESGIGRRILSIADKIRFEASPESVMLVGSAAMQKMRKTSDLDFLVVGGKKEKIPFVENANIVSVSEKELTEKYVKGDDFIISALVFGKIIYDREYAVRFLESPLPIFSQELIQEKIKYCETLEERIYSLLKIDETEAKNELLYLALQAGRLVLLRKRIVPKTKHDIAMQVKPYEKELSGIILRLLEGKKMSAKDMLDCAKKCMSVAKS
ncbi:nucleotidyltransferase domain-containing protein [archaeon]|nr:nucleotidyltransferase domain-containing protein [Nanoarchaeota archaeon]MBU4299931.1 nucleotidyltransferase domain-containing protein [Nanoarchaeota archaeon]MBU4452251.1 nucleotidyltransferase domain-containing protein [Nanoarchaeota archaeon]MCG2724624.1 nucleotidyltransferase domain-containing protein [archaeon]